MNPQSAIRNPKSRPGVRVDIIGDSGPFSTAGRSVGYRVAVRGSEYLIDCGAPPFEGIGFDGIARIKGLVGTHSHEDHRRWFTDIALFKHYVQRDRRLRLITTETIHEEYAKNSRGALERSLSDDSRRVIEIPYEEFVETVLAGPRARVRISMLRRKNGTMAWGIVDERGRAVPPERAKIVINHLQKANRPRLLYRDDATGEWVEPESYYPFSAKNFFEGNEHPFRDREAGMTIRPIKSPVWHGPPTIGVEITTAGERVVFSSDTVHDLNLWDGLASEKRPQRLRMGRRAFLRAGILYGDINDFIERTWSPQRYEEAIRAYDGAVLIHDVAGPGSIVHTAYPQLPRGRAAFMILTHSPDRFVSEFPVAVSRKSYRVVGTTVTEEVAGRPYALDADVYAKNAGKFYVGYRSPKGTHAVVRLDNGMLSLIAAADAAKADVLFRADLLRDVEGRYLPDLPDRRDRYQPRPDGVIERIRETASGSRGVVVRSVRKPL